MNNPTQPPFPAHDEIKVGMSTGDWFANSDHCITDIKAEFNSLLFLLKVAGEALERLVSAVDAYETISDEAAAVALYQAHQALQKLKESGVL